ncbi:MAG: TRAP transporter small permease [Desulfobacterota bacterium]|nr:TRAP transporter small permease [Thermodesulfobacteriota bacterium]MDW8002349.1 TRAP transporter small permease [Deltaproteobacteria bacterium]
MAGLKKKTFFDLVIEASAFFCCVLMAICVVTKFCEIILRYFFDRPLTWDVEFIEYILFSVTFFGTGWLLREGGHIRVDVLDYVLSREKLPYVRTIHSLVGFLAMGILALTSFLAAVHAYRDGLKVVKIYAIGKHYFFLIMAYGFFTLAVEFLRQLRESWSQKGRA